MLALAVDSGEMERDRPPPPAEPGAAVAVRGGCPRAAVVGAERPPRPLGVDEDDDVAGAAGAAEVIDSDKPDAPPPSPAPPSTSAALLRLRSACAAMSPLVVMGRRGTGGTGSDVRGVDAPPLVVASDTEPASGDEAPPSAGDAGDEV